MQSRALWTHWRMSCQGVSWCNIQVYIPPSGRMASEGANQKDKQSGLFIQFTHDNIISQQLYIQQSQLASSWPQQYSFSMDQCTNTA